MDFEKFSVNIIHYDNGISSNLLRVSGKIIPWVHSRCIKMQTNSDLASLAPQGRRDESIRGFSDARRCEFLSDKRLFQYQAGWCQLNWLIVSSFGHK